MAERMDESPEVNWNREGSAWVCDVEVWQNHAGFDCTEFQWSNVRQLTDLEPEQRLGAHPNQF
jgi:hypothetical protein